MAASASCQHLLQLLDLVLDFARALRSGLLVAGGRNRLQDAEIADQPLLLGPQILDALQGGIAVLHDLRRLSLHVSHLLTMTGDRHLRPNAARRPNVGGVLHRLFLFAALPFIVSGGADVIEEPVDALTDPGHGDDQPFFELADQRVPLGFEHRHFTLVFGKAADVFLGRPEALLVGDAQVLVEFRHERNRLHAHLFEQVHGGGVPLKAFRELVQALGDLRQNLGRGFHLSGGGVEIDAHPAQGGPRLFAFPGIVVGSLGQTAHQALDNRDVLPDRARREAELPDFLRGQAGAQFRVLHAGAVFAETLRRLECGRRNGAQVQQRQP